MKKNIVIILTIAVLLTAYYLTQCRQASSVAREIMVAAIIDTGTRGKPAFRLDGVLRVIKDTVKFIQIDEGTQKKKFSHDTTYFLLVKMPFKDSVGNQVKTKVGADSVRATWLNIFKRRVVKDFGTFQTEVNNYKQ